MDYQIAYTSEVQDITEREAHEAAAAGIIYSCPLCNDGSDDTLTVYHVTEGNDEDTVEDFLASLN